MKENITEELLKIPYKEGGEEEVSMPFDKSNMLLFVSFIFMINGLANMISSCMFYNIIYNPHVYVWDLNPKRTDFYSYIDFMKKRENLTIYKDEIIGFYKQVYNDTSDAEFFDNLKKITNYKPKIIVYINNLFIVSCMKLISALLVFLLRKYRKNWKKDMEEALGNTSSIAIVCFWFSVNSLVDFKISETHKFFNSSGIVFGIMSIIFKLYLFKLSYNDYFEYEQYQNNKFRDDEKID